MSKVHRLVERRTVNNVIFNGKWGIITKIFRNFIIRGGRGGSLGSGSNNPNAKPVIQLNIYGEFIKEWGSVIEAAKALQIDSSAIAKCCRHVPKYKRAGGYVWEYKENYGD